jgi:hypothetical protein
MFICWCTRPAFRIGTAGTKRWLLNGNYQHPDNNGDDHEGKRSDHDFVKVPPRWSVTLIRIGVDHDQWDAATRLMSLTNRSIAFIRLTWRTLDFDVLEGSQF